MKIVRDFETKSIINPSVIKKVNNKFSEIKKKGLAGIEQSSKGKGIVISENILEVVHKYLKDPQIAALEDFIRIQEKVSLRQYETLRPCVLEPTVGIRIKQEIKPLSSIAIIASGSWDAESPYALTSILVSASVSGVSEKYVFLAPDSNGGISPLSIFAAFLAGATTVYRMNELEAFVCLTENYLFGKPEQIINLSVNRMSKIAVEILKKNEKDKTLDLVVMTDSKSAVDNIIEVFISWITEDPLSSIYLITTSKRFLSKFKSKIDEHKKNPPAWWENIKNLQVKIVTNNEEAFQYISAFKVNYLLLPSVKISEMPHKTNFAKHIIKGDIITPLISKRITSAGTIELPWIVDSSTVGGALSFLKTIIYEEITPKTSERIKKSMKHLKPSLY